MSAEKANGQFEGEQYQKVQRLITTYDLLRQAYLHKGAKMILELWTFTPPNASKPTVAYHPVAAPNKLAQNAQVLYI